MCTNVYLIDKNNLLECTTCLAQVYNGIQQQKSNWWPLTYRFVGSLITKLCSAVYNLLSCVTLVLCRTKMLITEELEGGKFSLESLSKCNRKSMVTGLFIWLSFVRQMVKSSTTSTMNLPSFLKILWQACLFVSLISP